MPGGLFSAFLLLLVPIFFVVVPLLLLIRRLRRRQRAAAARSVPRQTLQPPRPPQARQAMHWEMKEKPVGPAPRKPPPAVQSTPPSPAPQPPPVPPAPMPHPAGRLQALPALQRAVAWAEILGPPRGLQERAGEP